MDTKTAIRIIIVFFSFIISSKGYAQLRPAIQWQKCLGGTGEDKANDVLINPDGSFIVVGFSNSNDGDVSGHHGSLATSDAWVVKLNAAGGILWQRSIGGTNDEYFSTVIATNDNAYLCIGSTKSNDGDVFGNHGSDDVWVVKINTSGTILWSRCYGGTKYDAGSDGVMAADGSCAIMGTSYSYDGDVQSGLAGRDDSDGWAFKIDAAGNIVWEKCLNFLYNFIGNHQSHDIGYNINIAEDGNFYALASGTEDYQVGLWPYYDTITRTPGKLYKLDKNTGNAVFIGSTGGDSSFAMCKSPYGYFFSFVEEHYQYTEFCFDETLYTAYKPNGVNTFSTQPIAYTTQCTFYNVQKTKFGRTHGLASEPTFGYLVAAGDQDKYTPNCCPKPTWAFLDIAGRQAIYGGNDVSGFGGYTIDAFRSVKVFAAGNEYIVAGNTNSVDGDVTGYHNGMTIGGPSDCWVVRLDGLNRIVGNVFLDLNSNGIKDAGELPFNHAIVKSKKQGFEVGGLTYNGFYINSIDTGSFTTTIAINRPYYTATPVSETTVFNTYRNTDTVNFAVHAIPGINDYTVSAVSLLPPRPGFNLQYNIVYTNNGTENLINKTVTFVKDSRSQFLGSVPANTSISGDTIRWNIASLLPTSSGNIILNLQLGTIPEVNPGDYLNSHIYIDSTGDFNPSDNDVWLQEQVTGSIDPNDKYENNNGEIYPQFIAEGKFLNYTIRFQNSGNDTAFNIILRDTLDPKLNGDSIEVIAASHPYTVAIGDKRNLTVTFTNIKLVDSIHNEPLSHGYFSYRIKPISTLTLGDTIRNNASIYFDFNPAVKTNSQITIVKPRPITLLWTGAVSTAWENPLNWGMGIIPDVNTDVIINAGLPRYPVVNSNAVCRSVQSKPGTSMTIMTGKTLQVAH